MSVRAGVVLGIASGAAIGTGIEHVSRPRVGDADAIEQWTRDFDEHVAEQRREDRHRTVDLDHDRQAWLREHEPPAGMSAARTAPSIDVKGAPVPDRDGLAFAISFGGLFVGLGLACYAGLRTRAAPDMQAFVGARGTLRLAAPLLLSTMAAAYLVSAGIGPDRRVE